MDVSKDKYMQEGFCLKVRDVIGNVTEKAVSHQGFAVMGQRGGVEGVYALAQCWRTISKKGCRECLEEAQGMFAWETRQGCAYFRYSTEVRNA